MKIKNMQMNEVTLVAYMTVLIWFAWKFALPSTLPVQVING